MPHSDIYLESTSREDKFHVGQIITRYGNKYRITRIEWNKRDKVYEVYGILV